MGNLSITYSYRDSDEAELEPVLLALEDELGGERHPYAIKGAQIDLVTVLEIGVALISGPATDYLGALLLGAEPAQLGMKHRRALEAWLSRQAQGIARVIGTARRAISHHGPAIASRRGPERAVVLAMHTHFPPLYVVLNHAGVSQAAQRSLPRGIHRALVYLYLQGAPPDCPVPQLYYDKATDRWRYLLAPTTRMLGRWIDRYVDLDSRQVRYIRSRREFLEVFTPHSHDEYKFLIDPFRDDAYR